MKNLKLLLAMATILLVGCTASTNNDHAHTDSQAHQPQTLQKHPLQKAIDQAVASSGRNATYLPSGVAFVDLQIGTGSELEKENKVVAHYVGWLPDGTKFENSYDRGKPGNFSPSVLVAGCAEGMMSMRVGGKRKVFVPANLAYGQARRPSIVPPDSHLIFEFELIAIE